MKQFDACKTMSFTIPSYPNVKLVRSGVPNSDKSSFIHCMLHSSFNDYSTKTDENKIKMVEMIRDKIAKNISRSEWEYYGSEWRDKFEKFCFRVFESLYEALNVKKYKKSPASKRSKTVSNILKKILENKDVDKSLSIYKVLFSEVDVSCFIDERKGILMKCFKSCSNKTIDDCKDMISLQSLHLITKVLKNVDIDDRRKEAFSEKFSLLVRIVMNEVENDVINKLKDEIKSINSEISIKLAQIIADKFERDVYFIDSKTMQPHTPLTWSNKGNRHFVVLLMTDDRYEIVGRVIDDTNKVQRNFPHNDPFISDYFLKKNKKTYHRAKSVSDDDDDEETITSSSEEEDDDDKIDTSSSSEEEDNEVEQKDEYIEDDDDDEYTD